MNDLPTPLDKTAKPLPRKVGWLAGAALLGSLLVPLGATTVPGQAAAVVEQPMNVANPVKCWFPMPGELVEGEDVLCHEIQVPLQHDKSDPRNITLATATLKSTSARTRADATLFLTGGPGQSGVAGLTEFVDFVPDGLLKTRNQRDIVFVDQRGTGYGDPQLNCPEFADPNADVDEATKKCFTRLSAVTDLSAYNTENNAKDMDIVRQALGYRQWNLYGVSYGSKLGYNILRYAPKGTVRSAILGSPVPHRPNWVTSIPESLQSGLNALYAGCRADRPCQKRYGNLRKLTNQTFKQLNAKPLTFDNDGEQTTVTGVDLSSYLFDRLYVQPLIRMLPELIDAAHDRDVKRFKAALDVPAGTLTQLLEPEPRDPNSNDGMYSSILCAEEIGYGSLADVDRSAAKVSPIAAAFAEGVRELMGSCKEWRVTKANPDVSKPVSSNVPTMVLAGSYDPVTPPRYAKIMASSLANSQQVTVRNAGHSQLEWIGACATKLMRTFYGKPGRVDASCAKERLTFIIPGDSSNTSSPRELQRKSDLVRRTRDLVPIPS